LDLFWVPADEETHEHHNDEADHNDMVTFKVATSNLFPFTLFVV